MCWRITGRALVGVTWVDTNKGDEEKPEYRCRLVAKEIKNDKREDDVVRAYFHTKARRRAHMGSPKEHHQDVMRGRLKRAMCGTRDAAQNWELEYSETMVEAGFTQGL